MSFRQKRNLKNLQLNVSPVPFAPLPPPPPPQSQDDAGAKPATPVADRAAPNTATAKRRPTGMMISSRSRSKSRVRSSAHTAAAAEAEGETRNQYYGTLTSTLASTTTGSVGVLRDDDLKDLQDLGQGNSGSVKKALHKPSGTTMAKKIVLIDAKPATRVRILRELQILHSCHSDHIVSFYGAYLADPNICICMEYMDKGSFDGIYKRLGKVPIRVVGKVAAGVLGGLGYLYEGHRIIHRDIKPSNILFNSNGEIKVCDFGVSGELVNSIADTFVGTSTYMSPERIQGAPYSVKSDVWSLGISIIELALGRFPFSDEDSGSSADEREDHEEVSSEDEMAEEKRLAEEIRKNHPPGEEIIIDLSTLPPQRPKRRRRRVAPPPPPPQGSLPSLPCPPSLPAIPFPSLPSVPASSSSSFLSLSPTRSKPPSLPPIAATSPPSSSFLSLSPTSSVKTSLPTVTTTNSTTPPPPANTSAPHQNTSAPHQRRSGQINLPLPRPRSTASSHRKSRGVSLQGTAQTMSILELLQHIVNEPPPRLGSGAPSSSRGGRRPRSVLPPTSEEGNEETGEETVKDVELDKDSVKERDRKFPVEAEEFVERCLVKDLERRKTPKELLDDPWVLSSKADTFDLVAWARTF